MKAGGIGSMRWPLVWETVQPTAKSDYDWTGFDEAVEMAARAAACAVLPFLYGTPRGSPQAHDAADRQRPRAHAAWTAFVEAAVERYGPKANSGLNTGPGAAEGTDVPRRSRSATWQVWNEANFFYFAYPSRRSATRAC